MPERRRRKKGFVGSATGKKGSGKGKKKEQAIFYIAKSIDASSLTPRAEGKGEPVCLCTGGGKGGGQVRTHFPLPVRRKGT